MLSNSDLQTIALSTPVDHGLFGRLGLDSERRSGIRLEADSEHDVWLLRWPPGSHVSPHDHGGSAGAFAVISGSLVEVRWDGGIPHSRVIGAGEVVTIEAGVVHDVLTAGATAFSIHTYSPPLVEMSFYDETGSGELRRLPGEKAAEGDWAANRGDWVAA